MSTPSADELEAARRVFDGDPQLETPESDAAPNVAVSEPAAMLAESRIDLVAMIRNGIPKPSFVPGCEPWLRQGKRYLCPASAGAGKSIAWETIAVTIVEAGGSVAILDVENGDEEYAGRLENILEARDPDGSLTEACQQRLGYFAWPRLSLTWTADEWTAAIGQTDLVIFDSSRMALTSVGLAEDSADDYSRFMGQLIMPLSRTGTATVVLDNTGHENRERSRGTKAKEDLNEVVYRLVVTKPFDRDRQGEVRLVRGRHRFAGLPREVKIELGGGVYGPPAVVPELDETHTIGEFRPTVLMERVSRAIEKQPGISSSQIRETVKGKTGVLNLALQLLVDEDYVDARQDGRSIRHHTLKPYREHDE